MRGGFPRQERRGRGGGRRGGQNRGGKQKTGKRREGGSGKRRGEESRRRIVLGRPRKAVPVFPRAFSSGPPGEPFGEVRAPNLHGATPHPVFRFPTTTIPLQNHIDTPSTENRQQMHQVVNFCVVAPHRARTAGYRPRAISFRRSFSCCPAGKTVCGGLGPKPPRIHATPAFPDSKRRGGIHRVNGRRPGRAVTQTQIKY